MNVNANNGHIEAPVAATGWLSRRRRRRRGEDVGVVIEEVAASDTTEAAPVAPITSLSARQRHANF